MTFFSSIYIENISNIPYRHTRLKGGFIIIFSEITWHRSAQAIYSGTCYPTPEKSKQKNHIIQQAYTVKL